VTVSPVSPATRKGVRDRVVESRRVPAGELRAHPRNWRKHPERQRRALRSVLDSIGYAGALLARATPDGLELIDGHLRADTTPDQEVPVLVLDVTEAEAEELLLSLDPIAGMALSNRDALGALLDEVTIGSTDLLNELSRLAGGGFAVGQDSPTPARPGSPITRAGDLWLLGEHRVLCGDSTSAADAGKLLDGGEPPLLVTDPPYGVAYEPEWRETFGYSPHRRRGKVTNDDRADWSGAWAHTPAEVAYVWHGGLLSIEVLAGLRTAGFEARAQIIWAKQHFPVGRGHYHWRHEPCWYLVRKGKTARWQGGFNQQTVWDDIALDETAGGHSTQKPLECMARPIRNHKGDVHDPFLGSGTTLIAAERLGRRCYGMEIDPGYVDVSVARWEAETGEKATRG